jgi:hypothetical protein
LRVRLTPTFLSAPLVERYYLQIEENGCATTISISSSAMRMADK